ncbi:MAG: hypothetical protein HY216_04285 [Candidatus Rokubacteria bacterium]|nr:hypothetical protein [Candidatus Rokubacteria bacterium]
MSALDAGIETTDPEREFAARVPSPPPERPWPTSRRAIFFDVENTSRAEHIARVLEYLAVDRIGSRTELVAVGNWRVVGHDTARLLAKQGAHLVHSAPSVGVRDWSDLRIAVGAGVWLGQARPGDVIEVISDDRAFDAVGDVAATLGITFRRLSFRSLAGLRRDEAPVREITPEPRGDGRGHHHRRGGRGRGRAWRDGGAPAHPPAHAPVHAAPPESGEPHTAPHDEIVHVVHDLIDSSPTRSVTLDTLANALKSRGFSRPSGSPRLITRLRRIREITVGRNGTITLVDGAARPESGAESSPGNEALDAMDTSDAIDGNAAPPSEPAAGAGAPVRTGRRRRSRRGGRRHRRSRGGNAPAPTA